MIETQPFKWTYISGLMSCGDGRQWGISECVFESGDRKYFHTGILNLQTLKFTSHAGWGDFDPEVKIVTGGGDPVVDHGIQIAPFRESHYKSSPRVGAAVTLYEDGAAVKLTGDVWIDWEEGRLQPGIPWTWVSFRMDNGSRRMVYEIGGETWVWDGLPGDTKGRLQKTPVRLTDGDGGVIYFGDHALVPAAPDQTIHDDIVTGTHYIEGFYWVEREAKEYGDTKTRVGHAYVEILSEGWGRTPIPTEDEARLVWAHGNESAAEFLKLIQRASQLADDFVDGDLAHFGKGADMVELVTLLLLLIPDNAFYQANKSTLGPVITSVLMAWECSDIWAESKKKDIRVLAYSWREAMLQVISMVGLLTGGRAGGREALLAAVDLYHGPGGVESFDYWDTQNASKRRQ